MNLKQQIELYFTLEKELTYLGEWLAPEDEWFEDWSLVDDKLVFVYSYTASCECCNVDYYHKEHTLEEVEDLLEQMAADRINNIARNGNNGEHYSMSRIETLKEGYRHDMIDEVEEEGVHCA